MPTSSVTVVLRLRPFLPRETGPAVVIVNGNTARIQVDKDQLYGPPESEHKQFVYDICLRPETCQEVLYDQAAEPILQNVLEGFNGTLFAYGQTGSGKSYSIMGSDTDPGVVPRLTRRLFEVQSDDRRKEPASEMRVTVSFLEIYNEELKDLLDPRPKHKKLYVHQHPKLGVYVPNLTEATASSLAECTRLLDFGAKIRATAQTNMNSTSSRSHSVFTMQVTQVFPNGKIRNSGVHLCDLAGSERTKKSGARGARMREGANINNSLSVLGQVISKLAGGAEHKGTHVPFRQSKLTYLLMDALSGNSVTTMLANISPAQSEAEETLSTLRFAESVKKVKTKPHVIELTPEEPQMMLESFQSEIEVLQEALKSNRGRPSKCHRVAREIEASRHLVKTFAAKTGSRWAEAVERTRHLQDVQQKLLQDMSLSLHRVGQLVGLEEGVPYLLNISDDPALCGSLIYFLRSEPEVNSVGQDGGNTIALRGLGIPAKLCEIVVGAQSRVATICKADNAENGRLLVNGQPIGVRDETVLQHADRIVFGWAFCFRLVVSGTREAQEPDPSFEFIAEEVFQKSMTVSEGAFMRAAGHWHSELQRRNVSDADTDRLMSIVGQLSLQLEEANALCRELHEALPEILLVEMDIGMCISYLPSSSKPPNVAVQVWRRGMGRLLAVWPPVTFERRLAWLREVHRQAAITDAGRGFPRGDGISPLRTSLLAERLAREEWWASGDLFDDDPRPLAGVASASEPPSDAEDTVAA